MIPPVMTATVERLPHQANETDDTAESLAFVELLRTYEVLSSSVGRFFQDHGVTAQQFNVLRILADDTDEEGLPCSSISDRLINRVPDITRLLDRLERAGLVRRYRDSRDRRVVRAALTEQGGELVERMSGPLDAVYRDLFTHLEGDELDRLVLLLQKARGAEGTSQ
ncbi:MAG: MarR family transcriptional regulator [Sandaracinus sp.]|nr:MarR family transcriptional regulator [Sandaracinus sp.]|tara:strand:+ start:683 stop:1183 length:501 start_codon:yes stop_codon:yes gene_type:complete